MGETSTSAVAPATGELGCDGGSNVDKRVGRKNRERKIVHSDEKGPMSASDVIARRHGVASVYGGHDKEIEGSKEQRSADVESNRMDLGQNWGQRGGHLRHGQAAEVAEECAAARKGERRGCTRRHLAIWRMKKEGQDKFLTLGISAHGATRG
jgi:hypothetical protein